VSTATVIDLVEAVSTSETSVIFYEATSRNNDVKSIKYLKMVKYLIFPYQILNVLCRHGRRVLKFKAQGKSTVMGRQKYKKGKETEHSMEQ
jgi:hypothetical protein